MEIQNNNQPDQDPDSQNLKSLGAGQAPYRELRSSMGQTRYGVKKYWKFLTGFLGIIIISGGVYFGILNAQEIKNFTTQTASMAGNFFSGLIGSSNDDFGLIGQINLETEDVDSPGRETTFPQQKISARECRFDTAQSFLFSSVIINEVAWMGTSNNANDEWIELKNISQASVDISGWQLLDKDEQIKIIFPNGSKIPSGGFYLLERNENAVPGIKADYLYAGNLKNNDDGLRFFDADCNLVDEVLANPSWPAGDNAAKKTMERGDDFKWYTSNVVNGTPKKANLPILAVLMAATSTENIKAENATTEGAAIGSADIQISLCSQENLGQPSRLILINEIAWAGVSSDKTTKEWIELKNNANQLTSLNGWQLLNKSAAVKIFFDVNDKIEVDGYYLLERSSDETVPGIKADKIFTNTIKNSDESLRLFDQNCRLIDEVLANPDWSAGTALPDYRTAERKADLSWQTYGGAGVNGIFGTPKASNSPPTSQASPPAPPRYSLIITKIGDGLGSIISNPAGIDCGNNCNEDFVSGATITLNAIPSSGSSFVGWSGACSGTNTCTITMDANKTITANFNLLPLSPPSAPARVIINEILFNPAGGDTGKEFVELVNTGGADIDLKNWSLRLQDLDSTSSASLASFGSNTNDITLIRIGKHLLVGLNGYTSEPPADIKRSALLPNTSRTILLMDKEGNIIDSATYDGSIPEGSSWERESWENNQFFAQPNPNPQNSQSN